MIHDARQSSLILSKPANGARRLPAPARRPAFRRNQRRVTVLGIPTPRLTGLQDIAPPTQTDPGSYQQFIQQQINTFQSTYTPNAPGISADDAEIRSRQIRAGVNPVDSGWYALGTKNSLVGPTGSDAEYQRLKPVSDYYKAVFADGGVCGVRTLPEMQARPGCMAELARNPYGIYYGSSPLPPATGPQAIGSGYTPVTEPIPSVTYYNAAPPTPDYSQQPDYTQQQQAAAPQQSAPTYNLPGGTTPPATTPTQTGQTSPRAISGPITQQLQQPTGAILPAAAQDVLPAWLKDLPLWQTGVAIAAVAFAYSAYTGKGKRR